ncbi:hypothetical protein [Clostridium sp.]|uniref:hypothetical protein n=1 Tax=Clostridium sp. TaxID=1506 RepID=UPI00262B5F04|nr:hypothetical protein [Clostridium sp.]
MTKEKIKYISEELLSLVGLEGANKKNQWLFKWKSSSNRCCCDYYYDYKHCAKVSEI